MLTVDALVAGYHPDLPIVRGAGLTVAAGEVVVVLGPNGAGKSTLVKAIAGQLTPFAGSVSIDGAEMAGRPAHAVAAAGVGYVPQLQNVFTTLSVEDNLRAGAYAVRQGAAERIREAYARFPDLAKRRRALGGQLSGGQRQMLAIARVLIARPRVLMLDEPSAGLAPRAAAEVFDQVRRIAADGVAVLMVEQNVRAGLAAADRGVVLVGGRVALEGPAAALAGDSRLGRLFLGGSLESAGAA